MKRATVAVFTLMLFGCAASTSGGGSADDWIARTQQLVIGATKAHTEVLTVAGAAYKAEAARCTTLATIPDRSIDQLVLYNCMQDANGLRTRIESAATTYRDAATDVLLAKSWADVLLRIPQLRQAASQLSELVGIAGGDASTAQATLSAPIDAALQNGGSR